MSDPVRLAILGAAGRMGRALVLAADATPGVRVTAAVEREGAEALGVDAGSLAGLTPLGVMLSADLQAGLAAADVLVDFTRPEPSLAALRACREAGKAAVVGTTGYTATQRAELQAISQDIPVCLAANFSIGINLCLKLVEQAAQTLGNEFDVEVLETHHRHKEDAPSGTALALGRAAAAALQRDLTRVAVYGREGHTGARDGATIGFATVRGGDVVGDHTVMFLGEGERVEITHKASSRLNFARGALRAAAWLYGRPPGLYGMDDVLGL